jgi:hypothetical protein
MTVQDYFKVTDGFSVNVLSNDLRISPHRNNRVKELETTFGAINFSYNVNKACAFSGFGILSSMLTNLETKSQTNTLQPNSLEIFSTENLQEITN